MLEIGSVVDGKYKILNKVGQGGMSVVYLAMNEKANKQWAVKEVRKDGVLDFEAVKSGLVAETDILKKLNHPNLPSIIDVIDTDESFIIIMDYIQGNDLMNALEEYGAQPQENVIEWAKQLADVLSYLHTRTPPIIYRDMKPKNIMLKPDGNVTLIDFGTAREFKERNLADTTCLGTVGYAAPEQFGGMGQTDARTDIYGLGATLYHLVTGMNPCEPPYEIRPIREINPALSGGLERIILKCTQRDPNDRYQSADELMYALEHYEEIDDIYRKKQTRKLATFLTTSVLTIAFAATSAWGYFSAEGKKGENYDIQLASATTVEDYYKTILTDTTRTEAYLGGDGNIGLIQSLVDDGTLTVEESSALQKLKIGIDQTRADGFNETIRVLEELKTANPSGYEAVAYEIGEAYLFYYDVQVKKDKYSAASTWFQNAPSYPVAKIYCEIAACIGKIEKYSKAEQYAKLYEEYRSLWEQLNTLYNDAEDFDEDLKVRVWREIVNMIDENATEFAETISKEDVTKMLDSIEEKADEITNTMLQSSITDIKNNAERAKEKLSIVKTENGQEAQS